MLNLFFWRSDASKHLKKLSALLIFFTDGDLLFLGGGLGLLLWYILVSLLRLIRGH